MYSTLDLDHQPFIGMENLTSLDLKTLDPSLISAVEEGSKTGSITPLLKEELKLTILNRRFQAGKGEIKLDTKVKPKLKYELSTEERRKKERRKEQNRRAAARCRAKKKQLSELVLQEYINEQNEKKRLEKEIETLKKEKADLQRNFDEHIFMCKRTFTPTPNQTPSFDDTATFTYPTTCSAPSPYNTDTDCRRDTTTPFSSSDPSDDVFSGFSQLMYPQTQDMTSQKMSSTISNNHIDPEEILLPDDFYQYQCSDQELLQMNGRQSISEYTEHPYQSH